MDYDIMMLYLYADPAYLRKKELWRGFLGYSLPILFSGEEDMIENLLSNSVVYHLKELTVSTGEEALSSDVIRYISMALAREMGEHSEFGLAAFFEGNLPTKFYATKPKLLVTHKRFSSAQEDGIVAKWLQILAKAQEKQDFIRKAEEWGRWLLHKNAIIKPTGHFRKSA